MGGFDKAIAAIDAENAKDPNIVDTAGVPLPAEFLYSQRMSEALFELYPEASDELKLAVRAQHIKRWEIPRSDYPDGKAGYHRWRNEQKRRHADLAGDIMEKAGYEAARIERVKFLIQKRDLKNDPETQALEDAACLVFLKYYFSDFAEKHDDDKMIVILKKSWVKMSEKAQEHAGKLEFPKRLQNLIEQALAENNS